MTLQVLKSPEEKQRKPLQAVTLNHRTETTGKLKKNVKPSKGYAIKDKKHESVKNASEIKKERQDHFEVICKSRVGENYTGDLEEHGIQEWSLDDFNILHKIGSGGTANVFLAHERQSKHPVALKIQKYDPDYDFNADIEIDIHLPLKHRNVVSMIDYFFSPELPVEFANEDCPEDTEYDGVYLYMILEVCNRGSLFDLLEDQEEANLGECWLDEADAVPYFRQCVKALQYIHDHKIIHCDIKAANFLVHDESEGQSISASKNHVVKLADFGMAVNDVEKEIWGGSPVYMAPEHLIAWHKSNRFDYVVDANDELAFDHRVDIYGLGVVLFQMLTGELPYFVVDDRDDLGHDLSECFDSLHIQETAEFVPPKLDLRHIFRKSQSGVDNDDDDNNEDVAITMPPMRFPERMSEAAMDLILKLTMSNPDERISLEKALEHPWLRESLLG